MLYIYTLNITKIDDSLFRKWLLTIPVNIRQEILQYKFVKDQKLKLFGKLLVKKYCLTMNFPFNWDDWQKSSLGKPYINNGSEFNISHSGDTVIVAFGEKPIGIDIEQIKPIDIKSVSHFFHPIEINFINNAFDCTEAFYKVWTRKEAYLKAKGVGMIENLNRTNCLPHIISDETQWKLETLNMLEGYQISICIPEEVNVPMKIADVTEDFRVALT